MGSNHSKKKSPRSKEPRDDIATEEPKSEHEGSEDSDSPRSPVMTSSRSHKKLVVLDVSGDQLVSFQLPEVLFASNTPRKIFTTRIVPKKQTVHALPLVHEESSEKSKRSIRHKAKTAYTLSKDRRVSRMMGIIDPMILPVFEHLESSDSRVFFIPDSEIEEDVKQRAREKYESIVAFNDSLCEIIYEGDFVNDFEDTYNDFYTPNGVGSLLVTTIIDAIIFNRHEIVKYIMKIEPDLLHSQKTIIKGALEMSRQDTDDTVHIPTPKIEEPEAGTATGSILGIPTESLEYVNTPLASDLREFFRSPPKKHITKFASGTSTGSVPDELNSDQSIGHVVHVDVSKIDFGETEILQPIPRRFVALPDTGTIVPSHAGVGSEFESFVSDSSKTSFGTREFSSSGVHDVAPDKADKMAIYSKRSRSYADVKDRLCKGLANTGPLPKSEPEMLEPEMPELEPESGTEHKMYASDIEVRMSSSQLEAL